MPETNIAEYTVSEISGAIKRTIEGEFAYVRVRGELGRVSRPASGHVYLDLKDDRSVLAGVIWKGNAQKMAIRPEQGLEVVATGRLTTFPGQSRYQIVIEQMEPAGVGALMALLEERKKKLAAEGLFDPGRKQPIPYLPRVIGVVTSPSGAVIRDILHRLEDRFPTHVLVWPVRVQGEKSAEEVAAAIHGFNGIEPGGPIPRPDLIIVARGGGSLEDLWSFNEEIVVRAAAESELPLIAAVGHETDWTLIDHAADERAPTPTAAAERAVPVRADLMMQVDDLARRLRLAARRGLDARRTALRSAGRALPRLTDLMALPRQRLDIADGRLHRAMAAHMRQRRDHLHRCAAGVRPGAAVRLVAERRRSFDQCALRLRPALDRRTRRFRDDLRAVSARLRPETPRRLLADRQRAFRQCALRLDPMLSRRLAAERRTLADHAGRLGPAARRRVTSQRERLHAVAGLMRALSHEAVLDRGFVLVRDASGATVRSATGAVPGDPLSLRFRDGDMAVTVAGAPARKRAASRPSSGSSAPQPTLFDEG